MACLMMNQVEHNIMIYLVFSYEIQIGSFEHDIPVLVASRIIPLPPVLLYAVLIIENTVLKKSMLGLLVSTSLPVTYIQG